MDDFLDEILTLSQVRSWVDDVQIWSTRSQVTPQDQLTEMVQYWGCTGGIVKVAQLLFIANLNGVLQPIYKINSTQPHWQESLNFDDALPLGSL